MRVQFAPLVKRLQHVNFITQPSCLFEFKISRCLLHVVLHLLEQGRAFAVQE